MKAEVQQIDEILGNLKDGKMAVVRDDSCPWVFPLAYKMNVVVKDRDMNAAIEILHYLLPGWGWRGGTCWLSDDAFVFADFNCPVHGQRLRAAVPEKINGEEWAEFTDIDYRPAGNPARALLIATLVAYRELCGLPATRPTASTSQEQEP